MTLVLANGVFDLLHPGHIRHLEEARKLGDYLVVGLTMDEFVHKPGRPILNQEERREMLAALRCISAVSLCRDSMEALKHWNPQVFVKGFDYVSSLRKEEMRYCEKNRIVVALTRKSEYSTTKLIGRIKCASS